MRKKGHKGERITLGFDQEVTGSKVWPSEEFELNEFGFLKEASKQEKSSSKFTRQLLTRRYTASCKNVTVRP